MGNVYSVDAPNVALTAATAKTLIELASGSTVDANIVDLTVGCDALTAGTLKVELIAATATGTGTAYTPKKVNGQAQNRAAGVTAKIADTIEPTGVTVLKTWPPIALPGGPFEIQLPLGREHYLPPSSIYGIRLTASVASNGYASTQHEE